jgi:hypothetical protein
MRFIGPFITPSRQEPEMTYEGSQLSSPDTQAPTEDGHRRLTDLSRHTKGAVKLVGRSTSRIIAHIPGTMGATQAGVHDAASALQTLPDPTLRTLAASSVGLGAGLYLTRAPRLVIVAGVLPAMIMGAAIALRPMEPIVPSEADR